MTLIRKLILREWFKSFFGATLVLFILLTVANLISGFLRGNVSPLDVIINHLIEIPGSLNRIFPIACMVGSLFSINKLKTRSELTAIFASGFSRRNYFFTLLGASITVTLVQFILTSYVAPFAKANRHHLIENSEGKFRNLKSKGLRSSTIGSGVIWYKSENYYFSFLGYNKKDKIISNVNFYQLDNNYKLKTKITAKTLQYIDKKWLATDYKSFSLLNGKSFPLYSENKTKYLPISEKPRDFEQIEADITTLNIVSLYSYINQLKETGINVNEYLVLFLNKISSSIICIIFTLISAITIFNPNRRNSSFGKSIGFVFVFTIIYWLVYSYFIELGKSSSIDPYLACFTVPIVFSLFISFFFYKNRRLS